MTTILLILALAAGLAALVSYARHDRFAGAANRTAGRDELGRPDALQLAV